MSWIAYEHGTTIGGTGTEGGTVLRDELHSEGARITLERTAAAYAVTCGVFGWMVHTRFFAGEREAAAAYEEMKDALAHVLARLVDDAEGGEQLVEEFVARFL